MPDANIYVVGSFVAACTVTVPSLPQAGETLRAGAFLIEAGGKGFNLAVAARRLGASVGGRFAIGGDSLATLAEPALSRADLPLSMLVRKPGATGGGVGFIAADSETCLAVAPGANDALSAADIRETADAIAACDACLAQFESPDEPIAEAFAIARRAGRLTVLNPSPFRRPSDAILLMTSVLVVNATEAAALGLELLEEGEDYGYPALAEAVFARGPDALVVTAGRDGAIAFPRGAEPCAQPAFRVEAVDTLGCGDAFAAGLAVSLAEGRPWPEAMRIAAACGALTATSSGVFDALPDRAAVNAILAEGRSG